MTSNASLAEPTYRRKLIEVDLPLDAINVESAKEKSIRKGHPSTLHIWWSRKPTASCRAVLFTSLVDDPIDCPEEFKTEDEQATERERLHDIVRRLVRWDSTNENHHQNQELLSTARWEIARSVARSWNEPPPDREDRDAVLTYLNDKALPVYDPFCGGGSIPLEAQRLGLRAVGSDLNPVAVLITKALVELPSKCRGLPPVNPDSDKAGIPAGKGKTSTIIPWRGTAGLAEDIRYYGHWMRQEAWDRIGHLYPPLEMPDGGKATVTAWLWTRTLPCPNPACKAEMPLTSTFQISSKRGNEHWARPSFDHESGHLSFTVQDTSDGVPRGGTADGRAGVTCIACKSGAPPSFSREQSRNGNVGQVLTALIAEGKQKRRLFGSPDETHIRVASEGHPAWQPPGNLPEKARSISIQTYGFTEWHQLFTNRQMTALTTFCDLMESLGQKLEADQADQEYAKTIQTFIALAISRLAHGCSSFNRWRTDAHKVEGVFARQGIGMIWNFAEINPFSTTTQNWMAQVNWIADVVASLPHRVNEGETHQANAATTIYADKGPVIVTDPPYYDNIHYADSSDFFYVWLRAALRDIHPELFSGILVPKQEEMIASRFRFENPRDQFESQLNKTLDLIRERCSPEFPASIFYAYKQQEEERQGRTSTGWETMLTALVNAGFQVTGTWPMRTEMTTRVNSIEANTLASSVILVCRPRPAKAQQASRREFLNELEDELPKALEKLTREGHIAPVDLAQAAIGPGMKVFSKYQKVETISGDQVTVREALSAINQAIANYDERQEGELDPPTRFCLDWLKQHGFNEGRYGEALTLSQAKNVSIEDELRDAHGLVTAQSGSVQLRPPEDYSSNSMPSTGRMTAWEGCLRMAWNLDHEDGSIQGAADIGRRMGSDAESVERLARILYNHYDRVKDSRRAILFNNLVPFKVNLDGYICWSLLRASWVENRQSMMAAASLRSRSSAAISCLSNASSPTRRFRHCLLKTLNSISAMFSQLP